MKEIIEKILFDKSGNWDSAPINCNAVEEIESLIISMCEEQKKIILDRMEDLKAGYGGLTSKEESAIIHAELPEGLVKCPCYTEQAKEICTKRCSKKG
jgi:hypothetical protein